VDQNLEPRLSLPLDFLNFARALSIYLKATQKHDPGAMEQIGVWYLNGRFEPKDLVEAWRWLTLAADNGSPDAAARRDAFRDKLTPEQWQQLR
jgi:TPR repeat protein